MTKKCLFEKLFSSSPSSTSNKVNKSAKMAFSDKVIIITGASSGIGAAIAVNLAKEDAKLSLVGRNAAKFEKVVERINETGTSHMPLLILADVSTDAERIISETLEKFGKIDVLINNAGFNRPGSFEEMTMENYDSIMGTNLRAAIQLGHLAAPHLIASQGNLLNISSAVSLRPYPGMLSYVVSKAAMDQFTKCAALELSPKGVRVNAINPGYITTDFFDNAGVPADMKDALHEQIVKMHPIGHCGQPEDIANAVAFVINNDLASFITGACIPIDGGSSIAPPS